MGHSRPLFLYFFLFYKQLTVNKCSIKVDDDWIWTWVLWYRKRPLCQLHHNHCHLLALLFWVILAIISPTFSFPDLKRLLPRARSLAFSSAVVTSSSPCPSSPSTRALSTTTSSQSRSIFLDPILLTGLCSWSSSYRSSLHLCHWSSWNTPLTFFKKNGLPRPLFAYSRSFQ